jgi:heme-degrading monooxygenase HmoA
MSYIYQISFSVHKDEMSELEIGASVERGLGYMRILLASQDGYVATRAMHTLPGEDKIHLIFESTWDTWEDFQKHLKSDLNEEKVLNEFRPRVKMEDLETCIYTEVD